MKQFIIVLFFIPLLAFTQNDSIFDSQRNILSVNQQGINSLVKKYEKILKNKGGIQGWKLQIKFTSKREKIIPYKVKFINLYPEIPVEIIFDSPYYKLTAGNFRNKNEALKIKHEISNHFPGAHPVSYMIDPQLLLKN